MRKSIKKMEKDEKRRLLEKLKELEPGSKEYREVQVQLGAYSIMDEKARSGKITAKDVCGWALAGVSTVGFILADQFVPNVISKVKLGDAAKRLFK